VTTNLELLGIQTVACGDYPGDRPFDVIAPTDSRVVYYNAESDPIVTAKVFAETRDRGLVPGAYFVAPRDSDDPAHAKLYAEASSTRFGEFMPVRGEPVMFDVEKVPLVWQAAFLQRWDELRPHRPTIYNVEPYQDATQNDYARMLARHSIEPGTRKLAVQTYRGGMQPLPPRSVVGYLTQRAIPRDRIVVCTDPWPSFPDVTDPARVAWTRDAYHLSAFATATTGAVLFQAGRIPR
jgi:hypothetical protein